MVPSYVSRSLFLCSSLSFSLSLRHVSQLYRLVFITRQKFVKVEVSREEDPTLMAVRATFMQLKKEREPYGDWEEAWDMLIAKLLELPVLK